MSRKSLAALAIALAVVGFAAPPAAAIATGYLAQVPQDDVWHDEHEGYPAVPSGLGAIRSEFGEPCTDDARANQYMWVGSDDGRPYTVYFHKLLGGWSSSNLDNDIPGHLTHDHWDQYLKGGIWGYNCRYKRGSSSEYSAHAWGIAVDINTTDETPGTSCQSIPSGLAAVWKSHRWTWGAAWGDCMHFQYATSY